MLAVVNQPRTQNTEPASFRIEGEQIPASVVEFLEREFPGSVKIDDDSVPFEETDWYKEISAKMTAGDVVKADRCLRGWTQKVLAAKLGISVSNLSEIERNIRPVSRKMAAKLAKVFRTDPASYFRFAE